MAAEAQRYTRLVGLEVRDDALYRQYREHMSPILRSYGGSFGYDFVVARVLMSETPAPINRVFTIRFPTRDAAQRFFSDTASCCARALLRARRRRRYDHRRLRREQLALHPTEGLGC